MPIIPDKQGGGSPSWDLLYIELSTSTYYKPYVYDRTSAIKDQIIEKKFLKIRRTSMVSISDSLEYVHATFFFIFENL